MARQVGVQAENNFIKGLLTETTVLKFPPDACTETFDCDFDETGRVTRRLGFDLEDSYTLQSTTLESGEAFTEFLWQAVAGDGNRNFLVQQQGSTLRFFNVSSTTHVSTNVMPDTIDLTTYESGNGDSAIHPCQYAIGNGDLIIVSGGINPIYLIFDVNAQEIVENQIDIMIRDFKGVNDGLDPNERPTLSVATMATTNPEHYYNLVNQGWGTSNESGGTDALTQWDAARADLPSNSDVYNLYRATATDVFDNAAVAANGPGNTPAPKGHFLLDAFAYDRDAALLAEGYTVDPLGSGLVIEDIPDDDGSIITFNIASQAANAFDGDNTQIATECAITNNMGSAQRGMIGKTLSRPYKITSVVIRGSTDQGFTSDNAVQLELYAKQGSAPASSVDGTLLGTASPGADQADESGGEGITSSDQTTEWDHVWINIRGTHPSNADTHRVGEVTFQTEGSPITGGEIEFVDTNKRPTTTAFYAGRVWYAGVDDQIVNSNVYFSQIIETQSQYAKCYQQQDPTHPDFSDLLPNDGGVVKILEIGKVLKLFPYQTSLIILATNGVWRIAGTTGSFSANDYQVRKLSSIGTDSPLSVADYKGLPIWWGEDGIYTLQYDPNYDSFAVVSLTDDTIKSFILDIPAFNRQYVKTAFDIFEDRIYWLYNNTEDLDDLDKYTYTNVLVFNGLSKAFFPWTIGESDPVIRGICYVQDGSRQESGTVKYTITINIDDDEEYLVYGGPTNTSYQDWTTYAGAEGDPADEIDYSSYFVTGYRIDGGAIRYFQSNYVFVFLEPEDNSSCFMQGIFDWTNTPNSGKWSALQQAYSQNMTQHNINIRRLKVRGKGRALQLRFESETGCPFNIIGWALWESTNEGI